jgi:hypothetical protein
MKMILIRMNGYFRNRLRIIVILTRKIRNTLPCWRELEAGEKCISKMEGTHLVLVYTFLGTINLYYTQIFSCLLTLKDYTKQ